MYELKEVDWHDLGIQLDVPAHTLRFIGKENLTETRKLSAVLQYCMAKKWRAKLEGDC